MVNKNLLINMIMLLIYINNERTREMCSSIIQYHKQKYENYELIDFNGDSDIEFEQLLIEIIEDIIKHRLNKEKNHSELKLLFNKIITEIQNTKNNKYIDYFQDIFINQDINIEQTSFIEKIHEEITNVSLWIRCNQKIKKLYGHINNLNLHSSKEHIQKHHKQIIQLTEQIKHDFRNPFHVKSTNIERIRLNNIDDLKKALNVYYDRNVSGTIKSGLQGLNNMCGSKKSFTIGKSILFCALSHHYKSTMLLSIARWIKEYNSFQSKDGKKPLVLFISLENEAHENLMLWFKYVYVNILKKDIPKGDITKEFILESLYNYFNQSDIEFEILRFLPNNFGFDDLVSLIQSYEEEGYYIVSCIIDYLRQMKLTDENSKYTSVGNHLLIKELFNKVCNYLKNKGITLFTAHQLNRAASQIVNSGLPYPVKKFNFSHIEGSMDVFREVDMVIFQHIEKNHNGTSFLTLSWGKHRYEENTPEKDKFIAYPFVEGKGIIDDIHDKFGGIKDIYAYGNDNKDELDTNLHIEVDTSY